MADENKDSQWNFHKCSLCPYRSKFIFLIFQHVRQHILKSRRDTFKCRSNKLETLKCHHCWFETGLKVALQNHVDINHKEKEENSVLNVSKLYTCTSCGLKTFSMLVMLKHIHSFKHLQKRIAKSFTFQCGLKPLERYKCKHCAFGTHLKVRLQHHLNVRHEEKKENFILKRILKCYQCKNCNFQTYSQLLMTEHRDSLDHEIDENFIGNRVGKKIEHRRRRYKCERCLHKSEWCTFKSFYKCDEKKHVKLKHGHSWATCDRCSYRSKQWICEPNDGGKITVKYKCGDCSYRTLDKNVLKRHVLRDHLGLHCRNRWRYRCSRCSFKERTAEAVRQHISAEHTIVPINVFKFKCEQCSFGTLTKENLKRHISLKHAIKVFNCSHCFVKTKSMDTLIKHIYSKHKNKAYKFACDSCSYVTDREDYFRSHIFLKHIEKIQRREDPFECPYCNFEGKSFIGLTIHMQSCRKNLTRLE